MCGAARPYLQPCPLQFNLRVDIEPLLLFRDSALLVVNKPAGLPTLVDGYHPDAPYLAGLIKKVYGPLWTVHRLDRDTSGVIVFALNAEAHRSLNIQFEQRRTLKVYHALVIGAPGWDQISVRQPLRANGDRKHRTVVDHHRGKPAHTDLRVLRRFEGYTLIEAVLHTGRTHQVRAHLAEIGFPIVGDMLYQLRGGSVVDPVSTTNESPICSRTALHAWVLDIRHPDDERMLHFEAPYPEDFAAALEAAARRTQSGSV